MIWSLKSMDFLDKGRNHQQGLLPKAEAALDYFAAVGQISFLDKRLARILTTHQNKGNYGQSSAHFNPQRWLQNEVEGEPEEDYEARLTAMKNADLNLGAGKRVYFGNNTTLPETCEVIATLFLTLDVSDETGQNSCAGKAWPKGMHEEYDAGGGFVDRLAVEMYIEAIQLYSPLIRWMENVVAQKPIHCASCID
ncbi:hypothetical protein BJ878DRAFT_573423 [Calycina marina]|uniref:Uncharacterized protein n=1 Tax=Calycina marina TaxID=1763456 RepID=A0A9P8CJ62_9HELO|nr:hypothetical protein BJ878DRAFT_573423 [Calycina marina]